MPKRVVIGLDGQPILPSEMMIPMKRLHQLIHEMVDDCEDQEKLMGVWAALLDAGPPTEDDIQRGRELADEYGWDD